MDLISIGVALFSVVRIISKAANLIFSNKVKTAKFSDEIYAIAESISGRELYKSKDIRHESFADSATSIVTLILSQLNVSESNTFKVKINENNGFFKNFNLKISGDTCTLTYKGFGVEFCVRRDSSTDKTEFILST